MLLGEKHDLSFQQLGQPLQLGQLSHRLLSAEEVILNTASALFSPFALPLIGIFFVFLQEIENVYDRKQFAQRKYYQQLSYGRARYHAL
jgi:hypothetical protein